MRGNWSETQGNIVLLLDEEEDDDSDDVAFLLLVSCCCLSQPTGELGKTEGMKPHILLDSLKASVWWGV